MITPTKLTQEKLNPYYLADGYKGEIISRKTGKSVGCLGNTGYIRITISYKILGKRKLVSRARLIWTLWNGDITDDSLQIDHINGIKTDDKISNLRLVSRSINGLNLNNKLSRNNTSGHKGVCFDKRGNRWEAKIIINGKITKKRFKTKSDAIQHRLKLQSELL